MEPTHFLSAQTLQTNRTNTPGPDQIDAFYEAHAPRFTPAFSRLRKALTAFIQRPRTHRRPAAHIAPFSHQS